MGSTKGAGSVIAAVIAASGIAVIPGAEAASHAKPLKRPAMAPAPAATQWNAIDLGTLGGPGSYANALTNGGVVVGCSDVAGAGIHAFAWQAGTMRDLGTGTSGTDGNSCAYAANDAGAVAGRAASGDLVVWKDGAVTDLGVKGGVGTTTAAVNFAAASSRRFAA